MKCLVLFLFVFFLSCDSKKKIDGEVVARVDNETLTKQELFSLVGGKNSNRELLSRTTKGWVEKKLLHRAAISIGLDQDLALIGQRDEFYQNLLISSFVDFQIKEKTKITKKEVSSYYLKNKNSFKRTEEEVIVKHFVLPTKNKAEKIKKELKKKKTKKKNEEMIAKQQVETKTIKRSGAGSNLVSFIFSGKVGDILGPKKEKGVFHVFEILQKHEVGSHLGLEIVYDEVYQRIYKQKEIILLRSFIDSLYFASDVFVSQSAFK